MGRRAQFAHRLPLEPGTVNATLYERLNFDFIRDIAPVAELIRGPLVMEIHPSVPANTFPEFIAYATANRDTINVASAGNGTPGQMASELFQLSTGLDLFDVPYRGGAPALTDLLAGQVQVIFDNLPTSLARGEVVAHHGRHQLPHSCWI